MESHLQMAIQELALFVRDWQCVNGNVTSDRSQSAS